MKKVIFIGLLLMSSVSNMWTDFLYFKFRQNDGYASYPPLHENYINKLTNERIVVNVEFENVGNEKKTNFAVFVRTLDVYDSMKIEKFRFLFDEKEVDVVVSRVFNLFKEINTFERLPPHYYSYFFTTKPKIDFRKMFKSHLKENEKFPLKVTVFYSIDDSKIQEVTYNFEVNCFKHFHVTPTWMLRMFPGI